MSSLYKLSIQGVRSFDSEASETIEFGFPLTLICGQNGCGKTTIIECLKYATTGDLPPNSKGGTFVNDPSIAARNTVNAQVKLAFQNVNGKSMICTRTMQLTKKRGKGLSSNTFKTLEGQLSVMDKGQKSTISTKNSELDTQIPVYLGASRAILDYVIFCHQDDSLWPLSEASVLKKRFDDIFEALKFTKVLDSLKTIKKDMTNDIKLIEQNVQHLRIDKSRADKIRGKVDSMSTNYETLTEEIAHLTTTLEKKEQEAETLFVSNQSFQEVLSKYEQLQYSQKSCQTQLERLKKNIDILPDTDSVLLSRFDNFDAHLQDQQKNASAKQEELTAINKTLQKLRQVLNSLIRSEGSLKLKEEAYDENKNQIVALINENALGNGSTEYRQVDIQSILNKLEDNFGHKSIEYEKLIANNKKTLDKKAKEARRLADEVTINQQRERHYQQDLLKVENRIIEVNRQKSVLHQQIAELDIHKSELKDLEDNYDPTSHNSRIKELNSKLDNERQQLSNLDIQSEQLGRKISQLGKQSDALSKISFIKEGIDRKKMSLAAYLKGYHSSFEQATGKSSEKVNGEELNERIVKAEYHSKDQANEYDESTKNVNSLSAKLENIRARLSTNQRQTSELKHEICKVLEDDEIDDYEQVISDLEENNRDAMESLNTFDVTNQFKLKAIEIAEAEKHCTLCLRPFDTPGLSKFLKELKANVNSMTAEKLKKEVNDTATELKQAKVLHSSVLKYRECTKELPQLEREVKELTILLEKEEKLQLKFKSEVDFSKEKLNTLNSLKTPFLEITRLEKEITEANSELKSLEDILSDYGSSCSMSPTEIQQKMDKTNKEIRELRQNISDDMEAKYIMQREISRAEGKIKDKKLTISTLERTLVNQEHEQATIEVLQKEAAELKSSIEELKATLKGIISRREECENELQLTGVAFTESEGKLENEVSSLEKLKVQLSELYGAAKYYEDVEKKEMQRIGDDIIKGNESIEELELSLQGVQSELRQIEKTINEANNVKGQIRDNLDLRRLQNEGKDIENQIKELDVKDAHDKRNEYNERSQKIRQEITDISSEHAGKIGEVKQLRDQIKALKTDLDSEYVDVDLRYQSEWVKLQTNMLASNDLQTYSKALDNAIMKYHSHKMGTINRILNELWKQTYKGTDVDTIAIKSDMNLHAKGNRSYNYRVVMYKQECELDMRGRCSAGQKVLTSILIRLALAECFGANCGIIALDEPTTNLDVENTESLAQSLNNIIEFRRGQKNFQLIVITHDEKFLSHIEGEQFTDNFYRLQRDENQRSVIRSLPINFILEA